MRPQWKRMPDHKGWWFYTDRTNGRADPEPVEVVTVDRQGKRQLCACSVMGDWIIEANEGWWFGPIVLAPLPEGGHAAQGTCCTGRPSPPAALPLPRLAQAAPGRGSERIDSAMHLRTRDDPEANGKRPQHGDERWTVELPLESGETLHLQMGRKSRDLLFGMLVADCVESGESEPVGRA